MFVLVLFYSGSLMSILSGTSCNVNLGFYCWQPAISHTTGNFTAWLGQGTGTDWGPTIFVFVPLGANSSGKIPISGSVAAARAFTKLANTGIYSGGLIPTATLGAVPPGELIGTLVAGSIWACYEPKSMSSGTLTYLPETGECANAGTVPVNYVQMATVTVRVS
ncbi:Uncharacterised protein [uncultured archaeon]|nr:Uncharacterised protein [uncultured archaeon]